MPASRLESLPTDFEVRLYRDEDEQHVIALLQAAFGRWPGDLAAADPTEYFRWKHHGNPRGPSLLVVAECDAGVVGLNAWLPYALAVGDRSLHALRGADIAVLPAFRGRGVAARIIEFGTRHIPAGTAFTFSNPNAMSRSGALRLGRRQAGRIPPYVRLRRPLRAALAARAAADTGRARPTPPVSAETAASALADRDALSSLLDRVDRPPDRIAVVKDPAYLHWRYGVIGGYHAVREVRDGRLRGLAIFRITARRGARNARVCELLVERSDRRLARRLLHGVMASAAVDIASCHFQDGSVELQAARRSGFVRTPGGETLLAYPLVAGLVPDPTDLSSWALTRGDLELL